MEDGDGTLKPIVVGIDLREASKTFIDDIAEISTDIPREASIIEQWAKTSSPTASQHQLLGALGHIILNPLYTEKVTIHFSPLLIAILDRSLQDLVVCEENKRDSELIRFYHCIARLVHPFPALVPLVRYFLARHTLQLLSFEANDAELAPYLISAYRLAFTSTSLLSSRIDRCSTSQKLLQIVKATIDYSRPIRLLALRILALLEDISDTILQQLSDKYIGDLDITSGESIALARDAQLAIQYDGITVETLNAWLYPLEEHERVQALRRMALLHCDDGRRTAYGTTSFGARIVCIGGRILFRAAPASMPHSIPYRETTSVQASLSSLCEKLSDRLPILISGPEACGKSSIIKYMCSLLHPTYHSHIITFQLGDQSGVDAKSLIGTYISSTKNPGTFEWAEGALTRAVRLGKWVVLEDVDRASGEVLSVIKPLVEDMGVNKPIGSAPSLDLGSRGRVHAAETFALFATRTTAIQSKTSQVTHATFYSHEHWEEVRMEALRDDDILDIVKATNPLLSLAEDGTLEVLVKTWSRIVNAAAGRKGSSSSSHRMSNTGTLRIPSLHDLLKWCRRIEMSLHRSGSSAQLLARAPLSNQAVHEEIFLEACDIFLGSTPISDSSPASSSKASSLFRHLAESLGVDAEEAWHSYIDRRPGCKVEINEETGGKIIRIGRTLLERSSTVSMTIQPPSRNFAMTGPAARLMERIALCVSSNEPTLLVGETGTGKTTVVQYLASLARKPLIALNLSQQTETSDLVGGFKPLDAKLPAMDLHNEWVDLFQSTFSSRRNARYMQAERKAMLASKWSRLCGTWKESIELATDKLGRGEYENRDINGDVDEQRSAKARRITQNGDRQDQQTISPSPEALLERWTSFQDRVESFAIQFTSKRRNLVFSFIEGPLIKAIRSGSWVLLDEINLATAETLDCLTALLQSSESSIVLTEKGDLEPVPRHAEFRLFACMNPATDIGKKDLPSSLRSRFTELYAPSPDSDQEALIAIVEKYIGEEAVGDRGLVMDVAQCYRQIRQLSQSHQLADGANQRPHYSIRTLSRALIFAKDVCAIYGLRRAVWEGFLMTFTMLLDEKSAVIVRSLLESEIMSKARNARSAVAFVPPSPISSTSTFVQLGSFWLEAGAYPLDSAQDYILTPSVQDKLVGLARAILTRRSPVLIQGPTSAGKTSAIEYLARRTGHKFVRINNHEHTDIQEYIGSYSSDPDSGQLVFQEGLLVTALRQGHWIVLDELNLAPSDVLEALNRLLDDNRELFISETGEAITPHPHFMLFATQNPPGQYAGRKELSRAFRNRFLEIHFADVPQAELQTILMNRCQIAPSYAEKIVKVFRELQRRRQTGRVFDTKQAFVTLRDLFRWGNREARDYQQLAENGYMLIAERARRSEDANVVKEVIEEVINVKIDPSRLYDIYDSHILTDRVGSKIAASFQSAVEGTSIVWTSSMQRLACLIASSLRNNEPVLLVGETGSGKTSVCEVLAHTFQKQLMTVNCHQNTDTADLLGGQRPLRDRAALQEAARSNATRLLQEAGIDVGSDLSTLANALASLRTSNADHKEKVKLASQQINQSLSLFEWHDGPLVEAMKQGQHMLLDEISLADDSVLERLNSVLEPSRTLVLAERSSANALQALEIKADASFQIIATMNPGGDYGKKELSPALRNRFTEIWVPSVSAREDLILIIDSVWSLPIESMHGWAAKMIDFLHFYVDSIGSKDLTSVGLRDLIAWARFINETMSHSGMSINEAFAHGAFMTFIDGVPLHPAIATRSKQQIKSVVDGLSSKAFSLAGIHDDFRLHFSSVQVAKSSTTFSIGNFGIDMGNQFISSSSHFSLLAPTPASNALRVLRAMQIRERAIMLEGSPGAGKTSLVVALAKECNHKLTRINLSDQTDLSDLFGADLPVEGGKVGEFDWKDAAFLRAMQEGSWVLLDEMNLASQTVLEGLNSCLDHRGSVFIPELGRSFTKHVNFRIFAAQNPQHQGGGRKGLPKSFLNRFTKVYIEELHEEDFCQITSSLYGNIDADQMKKMVKFNGRLQTLLSESSLFSKAGQPWEFNLRDLLRWFDMMHAQLGLNIKGRDPIEYLGSLYLLRFRTHSDRVKVARLYETIFGVEPQVDMQSWVMMTSGFVQLGHVLLPRQSIRPVQHRKVTVLPSQKHYNALQALGECVRLSWPAILVGESRSGKTTLVRQLAQMTNHELEEVRLNSGTDAIDVIGGFQQEDVQVDIAEHIINLNQVVCSIQAQVHLTGNGEDDALVWRIKMILSSQVHLEDIPSGSVSSVTVNSIVEAAQAMLSFSCLSLDDRMVCEDAISRLSHLSQQHENHTGGKFAWIDGPVLRAMRKGCWLLLDDANLCSSSVLDRLNSLLEPRGNLVLSERGVMNSGQVEVVTPHKDFRIFFAINPRYGELSRAMRNRGMEIYIDRYEEHSNNVNSDATISNLASWMQFATLAKDGDSRHKDAMRIAILAQGIPQESLSLLSLTLPSDTWDHLSKAFTLDVLSDIQQLKMQIEESGGVNALFLQQLSLDLQLNPATKDHSPAQHVLYDRIQLLFKSSMDQAFLQCSISTAPGEEMSILQRSALYHQGQDVGDLSRQDREIFSFINSLLQAIQNCLHDSSLEHLQGAIQALYTLLDCCGYLTDKWSRAALNDYSSSRVILAKAVLAARQLVKSCVVDSAQSTLLSIEAMIDEVRLDTGLAMHSIWRAFLPPAFDAEAISAAMSLNQLLVSANRRSDNLQDLVSTTIDVAAALWSIGNEGNAGEDRVELLNLARRAMAAFDMQKESLPDHDPIRNGSDDILLSIMYLATQDQSSDDSKEQQVKSLVKLIKNGQSFPLATAVSLQCHTTSTRSTFNRNLDWVKQIFRSCLPLDSTAPNTEDLFRPLLLTSILAHCSAERRITLAQLEKVDVDTQRLSQIISNINPIKQNSRAQSICHLLNDDLKALSAILLDTMEERARETNDSWLSDAIASLRASQDPKSMVGHLIDSESLPDVMRPLAFNLHFCLAMSASLRSCNGRDEDARQIGSAAMQYGITLIDSFLPNVAIDPLATLGAEVDFRRYQIDRLEQERDVILEMEACITGNKQSLLTKHIDDALKVLSQAGGIQQEASIREIDTPLLHKFITEMRSFVQQIVSHDKVEKMLQSSDDTSSRGRLINLQMTICAQLDRLSLIYGRLWDLIRPLQHALSMMLLGIGLLLHSASLHSRSITSRRNEAMLQSIVTFPTSLATLRYSKEEIPIRIKADSVAGSMIAPLLLLKVRAIVADMDSRAKTAEDIVKLRSVYDQLWHLWSLDEEHKKQQMEEETSLYKVKNLDMTVEEENRREEEEFLSLFPEYVDVMDEESPAGMDKKQSKRSKTTFLQSSDVLQLFYLHLTIFKGQTLPKSDTFQVAKVALCRTMMEASYNEMSEVLDKQSASLQLTMLSEDLASKDEENDFYTGANISEAKRMVSFIGKVISKLDLLIKDWPDQEVLHHIRQRCERILGLNSTSSVHQMLAAIEGLLQHTEDWEIFASSKNTLQAERNEMTTLIIDWRRLELKSWKALLSKETIKSRDNVHNMWFTLFQVTTKTDYEKEGAIGELVSLLDQFMRGSTLGQYATRLDLIESFALYLGFTRESLQQTSRIESTLINIHRFFSLFSTAIQSRLDSKRNVIEKEISDFVELASWKDTNIHALKVSASKTHRKLHRCLRKYRDVLNELVDPILASLLESSKTEKEVVLVNGHHGNTIGQDSLSFALPDDSSAVQVWHTADATPMHLMRLSTTLQTLDSFSRGDLDSILSDDTASSALLDLQSTIRSTSDALAKQTPSIWKQDNEKLIKHLETRKRKAWSDLLKELRRIGLTISSIDGVSASELSQGSMVFGIAPLNASSSLMGHASKLQDSDQMHYQLLSLLPVLRASINSTSRNEDLQVSQLQRGLSFVENCFLASVVERQKMSKLQNDLVWMKRLNDRLQILAEGQSRNLSTSSTDGMSTCLDLWRRLSSALEEIDDNAKGHLMLFSSDQSTNESTTALDQLKSSKQDIDEYVNLLCNVVTSINGTGCSMMTSSEITHLSQGGALLDNTIQILQTVIDAIPALCSMCIPTRELCEAKPSFIIEADLGDRGTVINQNCARIGEQSDRIISGILLVAQELRGYALTVKSEEGQDETLCDRGMVIERQRLTKITMLLRLDEISQEINSYFTLMKNCTSNEVAQKSLIRFAPFFQVYTNLVETHFKSCADWYHSLLKLDLTLCKLITSLATRGFCRPRQEEEQGGEAGNDNDEQLEGGMGLGEGEGAQDVTDTLQDDEMMEELESAEKEKTDDQDDEGETKGEKNAREMDQDFDGELGDVQEEEEEEKDGDDDEEQGETEMDDAVGKVDPLDLDAVDEKTWVGGDEKEKEEGEDKSEKEQQGKESEKEGGKEGKEAPKGSEENQEGAESAGQRGEEDEKGRQMEKSEVEEAKEEGDNIEQGKDGEVEEEGASETEEQLGENEEVTNEDDGLGRAIDEQARQTENLDLELDEDLQMDDAKSNDGSDDDMDGLSDVASQTESLQDDKEDALSTDDVTEQQKKAVGDDTGIEEENIDDKEDDGDAEVPHEAGEEAREEQEDDAKDDHATDLQEQQSMSAEAGNTDDMPVDDGDMGGDATQNSSADQMQSNRSSTGRQANAATNTNAASMQGQERDRVDEIEEAQKPAADQKQSSSDGAAKEEGEGEGDANNDKTEDASTRRSLGDALKEFKRNMDSIEERLGNEANREGQGMPQEEQDQVNAVEHILDGEDAEMQALGAAKEDEMLHDMKDVDLGVEDDQQEDDRARMDEEIKEIEAHEQLQPDQGLSKSEEQLQDGDGQGGLMMNDVRHDLNLDQDQEGIEQEQQSESEGHDDKQEQEEAESIPLDESIEMQRDALFASSNLDQRHELAQDLWKSYCIATNEYAFTLSEQLRLILTPTKATKLTGDFKTGKRLNMRKIIPFIASDYVKDKIWLRRNMPQKREYQVFLCIDDSKSMLESKNMLLAYKSLALVCSALDKLEVGQIGVMKFGKEAELLKDFDGDTLREHQGGNVIEKLQFQQRGTDVSAMLQSSYQVLLEAREKQSVTSSRLWQLQIIISDGVCQDHAKLSALLRRASEEQILVVFVILDSLQQNSSILTMNSVQYITGANGRPQIQMTRYLDTFPFEYFVVVRDVGDLPEVLSSTLRQWAQKIAES